MKKLSFIVLMVLLSGCSDMPKLISPASVKKAELSCKNFGGLLWYKTSYGIGTKPVAVCRDNTEIRNFDKNIPANTLDYNEEK